MTLNRAVVRSDKWYSRLFQSAADVIYVTDLNDIIISINDATEATTGRARADLIGRHLSRMVRPEYLSTISDMRERLLAGQPARLYQVELHNTDGESYPFEAASSLLIHDREPAAIQSVLRDIS